ncbi:hypothetical protein EA462_10955 [Natrarchaeobius halalkaliphilus]|uniref:Uncharacterized protein n=1 Tax=Natrarchaeobius halalkaliphilus TaxID=1679091 RepID=A0A3N6P1F9_9EURY|nr:hypothetical protein [Natrarchaeobius halalkaliphilus]RQG88905.1 hypothetical protein EA462_10955 [Natrarchaeobius halalkaliphilus]
MSIDLTEREEQEWLRREAPPLRYSELVSDEEVFQGVKKQLLPHFAAKLEEVLSSDTRDIFVYLREPEYYLIARVALDSASKTTIEEVTNEAKRIASEEDVSAREFAELYMEEMTGALFERVNEMRLRMVAKFIAKNRRNELRMTESGADEDEPDHNSSIDTVKDQSGLRWVEEELPKYKRKIIA